MQLFTNNADSSLNGAIDAAALSITIKTGDGAKFPAPTGGDFFLVTLYQKVGAAEVSHEIVKCTDRAGDVLTVARAQEGTSAQAFSSADPIEMRLTAGAAQTAVAAATLATPATPGSMSGADKTKLNALALPIPGLSGTPMYLQTLAALDETRILTGPYTNGYRNAPNGYLNVYFACLGLLHVVEERQAEAKAFLNLVLNTLVTVNAGTRGQFVIYDVDNLDTTPTQKDPDSNDSYAAMVNLLAYEYAKASGDWTWYGTNITRLKDIAYNNLAIPTKPGGAAGAGMVRTFQTAAWGAYYNICLTEDNCEVYAGLNALSKGCTQLGQTADASYYAGARDGVGLGMNNATTGVWDAVNNNWFTSDGRAALGTTYYADAVTQVFPEIYGVSSGSLATDRQRYDYGWAKLNAIAPQWETGSYDAFPWFLMGLAACLRGSYKQAEAQIDHVLRTRTRDKYTVNELGLRRKMEKLIDRRGLNNVDNTRDADKPVSAAQAAANTAVQTAAATDATAKANARQAALVSGTSIKTINSVSLLGAGDIAVGDVTLAGVQTLTNKTITALKETKTAMAANAIDLSLGNFFTKTIAGVTTLTVSNVPATGTAISFVLEMINAGSAAVTWFAGVKWAAGTAPALTAAGVDILGFYSHDGGTTWRGLILAKDSK